ncbi:SDR family oxidoreductase [Chlamydiales bacterium]|nr:SDR family oxidoreductase [Chlamydiales bacterium]
MWTLVTGGAQNLGLSINKALALQGRDLIIHYRMHEKEAFELAKSLSNVQVKVIYGDFSTKEGVESFIQELPESIDTLINNVGNYMESSLLETPMDDLFTLFQTNFHTPFRLIQALSGSLKNVVNIGVAGLNRPRSSLNISPYLLTKGTLLELTCAFAKELAPKNIRVNMVSPGYLENTVIEPKSIPLGVKTSDSEIVKAIIYLLDPENITLTGQNIEVSGGVCL